MHGIIAIQISLSYQKPNFGNYFQLQSQGVSAKFLLITTSRIIKSYFTLVCLYADEWSVGLATSCRWIPKKLPIKVSKSCQKVAEKLLNFQKVAEKLPKFFCFSYLFWVLKIKNSHIASYQNFICQSPMIISEVLSISLDQQIVYQNDMNKTW